MMVVTFPSIILSLSTNIPLSDCWHSTALCDFSSITAWVKGSRKKASVNASLSKKVMVHQRSPKCYLGQIQHTHNLGTGVWFHSSSWKLPQTSLLYQISLTLTQRDSHEDCFQNVFLIFRSGTEGYPGGMSQKENETEDAGIGLSWEKGLPWADWNILAGGLRDTMESSRS